MRRSVIIAVAAILMVVAVSVAGADEPVLFAYVMEEGQAESFKVKFSQETDLGFFMLSFFVDMEVTERCIKADSVGYTMEMTFDKVEASRLFQEKMTQDPMSNNLTGARVTYRVDRHGEVTDIKATGYIEGWSQAERVIKPIIESGYAYLPDREVAAGGEWGKDAEIDTTDAGLEITTTSKFKFKETKKEKGRQCAKVEGRVQNIIGGETDTPQGLMAANGEGKGKFEIFFDVATHTVIKLKASMDIKMDLVPQSRGDTIETTISYSLQREIM